MPASPNGPGSLCRTFALIEYFLHEMDGRTSRMPTSQEDSSMGDSELVRIPRPPFSPIKVLARRGLPAPSTTLTGLPFSSSLPQLSNISSEVLIAKRDVVPSSRLSELRMAANNTMARNVAARTAVLRRLRTVCQARDHHFRGLA